MPKTLIISAGTPVAIAQATTRFCSCAVTNISSRADESLSQIVYQTAGTFSKMFVRVTANTATTTTTIRLRINGADGNQTITVAAGQTGIFEDATNSDTITAGAKVGYQTTVPAGAGAITIGIFAVIFSADTDTVTRVAADIAGGAGFANASVSRFNPLVGETTSAVGAEASTQTYIRKAGTLRNLEVYVRDNARTTTTTVRTRINGSNGTQVITIGAGQTGLFEDTTHTDAIAIGDNADYVTETGTGTETLTIEHFAVDYVNTAGFGFLSTGRGGALTQNVDLTNYTHIGGNLPNAQETTEANRQAKCQFAATFSEMTINVTANTVDADSFLRFRKGAGDGNQVITVASNTTGVISDSTNVDVCSVADLINYQLITGTGTGNMVVRNISISYAELQPAGDRRRVVVNTLGRLPVVIQSQVT